MTPHVSGEDVIVISDTHYDAEAAAKAGQVPYGSSASGRETDRIEAMSKEQADPETSKGEAEGSRGMNNPVQVEQDNRVAQVAAEAKANQQGSTEPVKDQNKDG